MARRPVWVGCRRRQRGHLASLVQYDIMDNELTRTGTADVVGQYGTEAAIQVGDLFIVQAIYAIALCSPEVPQPGSSGRSRSPL